MNLVPFVPLCFLAPLFLFNWWTSQVLPFYPERFEYDQRIVYNHALLAFTGMSSYLAMIDLDE